MHSLWLEWKWVYKKGLKSKWWKHWWQSLTVCQVDSLWLRWKRIRKERLKSKWWGLLTTNGSLSLFVLWIPCGSGGSKSERRGWRPGVETVDHWRQSLQLLSHHHWYSVWPVVPVHTHKHTHNQWYFCYSNNNIWSWTTSLLPLQTFPQTTLWSCILKLVALTLCVRPVKYISSYRLFR